MSFSLAFWSSVSVFGNNTSNVTYRSPFLLLWYSGMPSPLNFLISLGLVIPCESVTKLKWAVAYNNIIAAGWLCLYLGADFHQMVVKMLDSLLKTNQRLQLQQQHAIRGGGEELITRLAGKTRENCWTATSWIQEYKDVLYWFFQRASSRWSSKFRSIFFY